MSESSSDEVILWIPPVIPTELCQDIAAHIHADGPEEGCNFSLRSAEHTHSNLSLTSRSWLDHSRRISFEVPILDTMTRFCKFLELVEAGNCTFLPYIRRIVVGDPNPNGWATTSWETHACGWIGDYTDYRYLLQSIPSLEGIVLSCIDHTNLTEHQYFNCLNRKLSEIVLAPPSGITSLTIRSVFFDDLDSMDQFLAHFVDLRFLTLYGLTSELVQGLPHRLPPSIIALKLVEDSVTSNHGKTTRSPPVSGHRTSTPLRSIDGIKEIKWYNISLPLLPDAVDFFLRVADYPLLLEIAYPLPPNSAANSKVDYFELAKKLKEKKAKLIILDKARMPLVEPDQEVKTIWRETDPETYRRVFRVTGWEQLMDDDWDMESEDSSDSSH